jgi:hypothetical protein
MVRRLWEDVIGISYSRGGRTGERRVCRVAKNNAHTVRMDD